ncbi:MAG: hypothetical protein RLZZ490_1909 [Cyanobacteriota bacterium]|jgi:hypothetical protein
MLALMLSGVIGSASLVFFFSAFFAPRLHRKDDFLWSGFGFFYALILWICAQRFTGAILLGQLVGVCLILAFAWQTIRLRGTIANQGIAEVEPFSLLDWIGGGLKRKPKIPQVEPTPATSAPVIPKRAEALAQETFTEAVEKVDQVLASAEAPPPVVEAVEAVIQGAIAPTEATGTVSPENLDSGSLPPSIPPPVVMTETPKPVPGDRPKKPKSKLFQWLFRGKKQQSPTPAANVANVNVANVIESIETDDDDWGEVDAIEDITTAIEDVLEEAIPPEDKDVIPEGIIQADNNEVVIEEAQPVTASESPEAVTARPLEITIEETLSSDTTAIADPAEFEQADAGQPIENGIEHDSPEPAIP